MYIILLASIASITRNNLKLLEKDTIESRLNVELRNIARLAQSVEHETLNLRVVGSSPTLGDIPFLGKAQCLYTIFSISISNIKTILEYCKGFSSCLFWKMIESII